MQQLSAFLLESILLSLSGGILGLFVANFMSLVQVSTTNWDTFSELAFNFSITPSIILSSLVFSVLMGLLGGFLPAFRASRLKIVDSLRAT